MTSHPNSEMFTSGGSTSSAAFHNIVCRCALLMCSSRAGLVGGDRKSTRLNSSHTVISYAVFCLKKKTNLALTTTTLGRIQEPGGRQCDTGQGVRRPTQNAISLAPSHIPHQADTQEREHALSCTV